MKPVNADNALRSRYWFLTWTTYGSWLPGDERGFIGETRKAFKIKEKHNVPGTPCGPSIPALQSFARNKLRSPVVYLKPKQALALLSQFQETADVRGWRLVACAIMRARPHCGGCVGRSGSERRIAGFQVLRQPLPQQEMEQTSQRNLVERIGLKAKTAGRACRRIGDALR